MSSFTGPAFAEDDVAIIPQLISTTVIPRQCRGVIVGEREKTFDAANARKFQSRLDHPEAQLDS